jgi:hypothetical protein
MKDLSEDDEKCPYDCVDGIITTEYPAYQREGDTVDSKTDTQQCPLHGEEDEEQEFENDDETN